MKINKFTAVLAFLLAAITGYFLSSYKISEHQILLGLGSFICLFLTAVATVSVSFDYDRTTTLVRIASSVFFCISLVSQILFANISYKVPTYILVNGLLLVLFLLVSYSLANSKH